MDEVKALFPKIIYTDKITKQRGLVRYILCEFHKQAPSGVTVDYDKMTVEHLVPQSQVGSAGFTEDIIGQLGNLILVSADLNERLSNKPFAEKKKILQASGVSLPPELAAASDWTPAHISGTTEQMAQKAYSSVWKI